MAAAAVRASKGSHLNLQVVVLVKDPKTQLASRKFVQLSSLYDQSKPCVIFTFPADFSPTCHNTHLPGVLGNLDGYRKLGCKVICITTDNIHSLEAWHASDADVTMASDCSHAFGKATDLLNVLNADPTLPLGLKRSSVVIVNDDITYSVEDSGKQCTVSNGESTLKLIASLIDKLKPVQAAATAAAH